MKMLLSTKLKNVVSQLKWLTETKLDDSNTPYFCLNYWFKKKKNCSESP